MCSSATALHAFNKVRLKPGDYVAIFGLGGLGFSALQLARAFACRDVYAVDVKPAKLTIASEFGAVAIDATAGDPVDQILEATDGKGVDVSLELVGSTATMGQAVRCGRFGPRRARWSQRRNQCRSVPILRSSTRNWRLSACPIIFDRTATADAIRPQRETFVSARDAELRPSRRGADQHGTGCGYQFHRPHPNCDCSRVTF